MFIWELVGEKEASIYIHMHTYTQKLKVIRKFAASLIYLTPLSKQKEWQSEFNFTLCSCWNAFPPSFSLESATHKWLVWMIWEKSKWSQNCRSGSMKKDRTCSLLRQRHSGVRMSLKKKKRFGGSRKRRDSEMCLQDNKMGVLFVSIWSDRWLTRWSKAALQRTRGEGEGHSQQHLCRSTQMPET